LLRSGVTVFIKRHFFWIWAVTRDFTVAMTATISIGATSVGSAANASTITSPLTIPFCAGCSTAGQVSVADNGTGTLTFQVSLSDTYQFVGGVNAFAFNLTMSPTITFTNLMPAPFAGGNTSAANLSVGGFGPFMYGVTAPGTGPDGQSLGFDVTANGGLTLSDLIFASNGHLFGNTFAVHICPVSADQCGSSDNNYAFTFIGGGFTPAPTPIPAALALFASVLGGGILIATWRRNKSATRPLGRRRKAS
jgi:hypothetical protein